MRRTLIVLMMLTVAGCGAESISPYSPPHSKPPPDPTAGNGMDRAYARAMAQHLAQTTASMRQLHEFESVHDLARRWSDSANLHLVALSEQERRLAAARIPPAQLPAPPADPAVVNPQDTPLKRVLRQLAAQHQQALFWHQQVLAKGRSRNLRQLVQKIQSSHQRELAQMQQLLNG